MATTPLATSNHVSSPTQPTKASAGGRSGGAGGSPALSLSFNGIRLNATGDLVSSC